MTSVAKSIIALLRGGLGGSAGLLLASLPREESKAASDFDTG